MIAANNDEGHFRPQVFDAVETPAITSVDGRVLVDLTLSEQVHIQHFAARLLQHELDSNRQRPFRDFVLGQLAWHYIEDQPRHLGVDSAAHLAETEVWLYGMSSQQIADITRGSTVDQIDQRRTKILDWMHAQNSAIGLRRKLAEIVETKQIEQPETVLRPLKPLKPNDDKSQPSRGLDVVQLRVTESPKWAMYIAAKLRPYWGKAGSTSLEHLLTTDGGEQADEASTRIVELLSLYAPNRKKDYLRVAHISSLQWQLLNMLSGYQTEDHRRTPVTIVNRLFEPHFTRVQSSFDREVCSALELLVHNAIAYRLYKSSM